jgi:Mg-chelatase subunit ChlD
MGVFLLIAVIALPYYLKTNENPTQRIEKMQAKIAQLQARNEKLREENAKLQARSVATLIGISTDAKSFVMLVDMSGSMSKYTKIVLETADRIIDNLQEDCRLQIVGYHLDDTLVPWQIPYNLARTDVKGKRDAKRFVRRLTGEFGGGTPTYLALKEALKYGAEAVVLLTDGAPSFTAPDRIVHEISQANGGKKEIYAIAIGQYRAKPVLVEFLQALSRENGGKFMGVSNY